MKNPLRSSIILNTENNDQYCFPCIHPIADPKIGHGTTVSNYRQSFSELNINGFYFLNGFKSSDMLKLESSNNFSINKFELNVYQDQNI